MLVVCAEGGVTLGAFALARGVTRLETVKAEDVKTLGQDGVLLLDLARRTRQLLLFARTQQQQT